MKNQLLDALNAFPKQKGFAASRFEVSLQINTSHALSYADGFYFEDTVKGTRAEVTKAVKKFAAQAKDLVFDERVNVIYFSLSHNYQTVLSLKLDLHKRTY